MKRYIRASFDDRYNNWFGPKPGWKRSGPATQSYELRVDGELEGKVVEYTDPDNYRVLAYISADNGQLQYFGEYSTVDEAKSAISEEINRLDDLAFDEYKGKKYLILRDNDSRYTDDKYTAIKYWFEGQKKHPMGCAILSKYKADAIALVGYVTPQLLEDLNRIHPQGYKLDYLYDECQRQVANNCRGFLGNGQYGDQIHPFSFG